MSTSTSSLSNVYLTKESGELVVREGTNPNKEKHSDKRVLIVGGGVTGLTVSSTNSRPLRNLLSPYRTPGHFWMLGTQLQSYLTAGRPWRIVSPLKLPVHCE